MTRPSTEFAIALTALAGGALTLGVEIVCGRLLAPYFGSSLHQWAALIGVVLLAYASGYAAFARLNRLGPGVPLALGGAYVLLMPFWVFKGLDSLMGLPLAAAAVIGSAITAGVPSFFWASVLPFLQEAGGKGTSARVLAWSAAGNLAGVWGIAFLAIPYAGTRVSLFSVGAGAVALAALWLFRRPVRGVAAAVVAAVCLASLVASGLHLVMRGASPWKSRLSTGVRETSGGPARRLVALRDSPYQEVAVWDEGEGRYERRALSLNGSLQFLWRENEPLIPGEIFSYYNFATAAALWTESGRAGTALVIGLGGGLVPWQLRRFFPDIRITAYELDPVVAEMAETVLPLSKAGPVKVILGDGRNLLRADPNRYDYILLDTFLNSYVPFHLTTREFFELVRDRLAPGGILVANFHTIFSTSGLLGKLEATMAEVFPSVGVVSLPSGTTLVLASPGQDPLVSRLRRAALAGQAGHETLAELSARAGEGMRKAHGSGVLTDDLNDTEQKLYETRRHILVTRPI